MSGQITPEAAARAIAAMTPLERMEYDSMLDELARKRVESVGGAVVRAHLFEQQRGLFDDPHRFITACCGRRGGKTVGAAAIMLSTAVDNAKRVVIYATLTKTNAKLIIWPTLKELNEFFGLGGEVNEADLTMTFPNGAVIVLVGVDNRSEIEKRRGFGIALFVLDECQSVPEYVKSLVDDVIAPALVDVPGKLLMIGTPSMLASGYWHECHNNKNDVWGHHTWTLFDNPTLPDPRKALADELARRGVTESDVSIQREWFARWVRDLLSAVFAFSDKDWVDDAGVKHVANVYDPDAHGLIRGIPDWLRGLPIHLDVRLWQYIISVDLGGGVERDNDAVGLFAFHPDHRATWLVEEIVSPKDDVTGVSLKAKDIVTKVGERNVVNVVVDTGGIGAKVALEMASRHHLPVVAAKKQEKWANIELLNAACRRGEFFAFKRSKFAALAPKVEKDWSKSTPEKIAIKGHMPDVCDMALYGYIESTSWLKKADPKPADIPGTREWADLESKRMMERARLDVERQKRNMGGGATEDWGVEGAMDFGGGIEWGDR